MHVVERLGADVGGLVGLVGDVERIMPLLAEGHLLDGLLVGQVVSLLQKHRAHDRIKLLGRPAEVLLEKGHQLFNGQDGKDMLPEQPGPGLVQELAPFGAEMPPRIEQVALFVVCHGFLPLTH